MVVLLTRWQPSKYTSESSCEGIYSSFQVIKWALRNHVSFTKVYKGHIFISIIGWFLQHWLNALWFFRVGCFDGFIQFCRIAYHALQPIPSHVPPSRNTILIRFILWRARFFQTRGHIHQFKDICFTQKLEVYVFRILRGVRCGGILAEGTITFSPYARWRCPNHCVSMALRQAPWSGSA